MSTLEFTKPNYETLTGATSATPPPVVISTASIPTLSALHKPLILTPLGNITEISNTAGVIVHFGIP